MIDDDEEFVAPLIVYPTASDLELVAFATGSHSGLSADYLPVPDDCPDCDGDGFGELVPCTTSWCSIPEHDEQPLCQTCGGTGKDPNK